MKDEIISPIREFNRFYTTILGVVNNHILNSEYSLTEARVIYELANSGELTARGIKEKLQIDEGYMSRIIASFLKKDILVKKQSKYDKRLYPLKLTEKGKEIASEINEQSDRQIKDLVKHLSNTDQEQLVSLIVQVKDLLERNNKKQMAAVYIKKAESATEFEKGRHLFEEYAGSLNFDLGYQDFEKELQTIDLQYRAPSGALLLCFTDNENAVGCAGIRKLAEVTAELKRLYVMPEFRSLRIGKSLLQSAIDTAKQMNYQFLRLDTVPDQTNAQQLYRHFGFYEIDPYRYSPIEGTIYMEKRLSEN
jgi:DNA-binding MarR family transcriptional regulator/GNAT superfamily N-acetyltransferase